MSDRAIRGWTVFFAGFLVCAFCGWLGFGAFQFSRPRQPSELERAAVAGELRRVEALLDQGASANERTEMGQSVLLLALYRRQYAVAELLVRRGADVNARDNLGFSIYEYIEREGDERALKWLLEKGAQRGRPGAHPASSGQAGSGRP